MSRVLLVEDDNNLAFGIEYTLKNDGFDVTWVQTVELAKQTFNDKFDLILLDVMLPDGNGYDFCKLIRQSSEVPIIFLTACDEEFNVVMGLDIGADDYMTKPIRIKELVSRINAVLRRKGNIVLNKNIIICGDIEINTLESTVKKFNKDLMLTPLEYKLILMFTQNPNQVLSRNAILDKLWDGNGEFIDDNTLSVHIRRLRGKIEDDSNNPKYIVTCRGIGYKLANEV